VESGASFIQFTVRECAGDRKDRHLRCSIRETTGRNAQSDTISPEREQSAEPTAPYFEAADEPAKANYDMQNCSANWGAWHWYPNNSSVPFVGHFSKKY
jgi:hypothetical protein